MLPERQTALLLFASVQTRPPCNLSNEVAFHFLIRCDNRNELPGMGITWQVSAPIGVDTNTDARARGFFSECSSLGSRLGAGSSQLFASGDVIK